MNNKRIKILQKGNGNNDSDIEDEDEVVEDENYSDDN